MKYLLVLLAVVAIASAFTEVEYQSKFSNWMVEHGKTYGSDEFQYKYQVYKNNLDFVTAHNLRDDVTFTVATNEFADLTNEEFVSMYTGYRGFQVKYQDLHELANEEPTPSAATVDWRTSGAVTPIKNQGQCGSCWSFSTTGSIEGNKQINTGTLTSLSEQNLMDCSWNQGNMGCDGGLMDYAFQYVISNMGIDTEASYPYTAESSQTCKYSSSNSGATITGYMDVTSGSESALYTATTQQPVSVAIDASHNSFQLYSGGVYYEPACSSTQLDHGVLSIGYGTDSGSDYWLVKNSWGTGWGLSGYIMMSRNRNNNCGIATAASYPTGGK